MKVFNIINPKILRCRKSVKLGAPSGLGYVTDSGIIFSSEEARKACSKAVCLKGPLSEPPKEVLTVSQGNKILYIGEGSFDSVEIPKKFNDMPFIEIEHSHPHDTPLSLTDYHTFLTNKYHSILAYTPDGRYSKIIRLPEKKHRFFQNYFQKKDFERKMATAKRCFGYTQSAFFEKTAWLYKALEKAYDLDIVAMLQKKTAEYGQAMNVNWEMLAQRLGVKYESNLREKPKFSIFERVLKEILKQ